MDQSQMKVSKATFNTFMEALRFASYKHRFQRRKNEDIPYINHPIEVAEILTKAGVTDYSVLSAALLHDTIQDTDTTVDQLQKNFGTHIKDLVLECTDDKKLGKVQRKAIQITKAHKATKQAKLIKIADKLSNCVDLHRKSPSSWSNQRVQGYYLWAFAVCQHLKGVNQNLDQQMDKFFKSVNVTEFNEQDKKKNLDQYYVILGAAPGQK